MATTTVAIRTAAAWAADQTAMEALYGVGGYYTTVSAWLTAITSTDLVTDDETHVAVGYDDWPSGLTDTVSDAARTTDATRNITLTVAEGHRGLGQPDAGFRLVGSSYGTIFTSANNYTVLEHVGFVAGGIADVCINLTDAENSLIDSCVMDGKDYASTRGIQKVGVSSLVLNNVIIDCADAGVKAHTWNPAAFVHNTIKGCGTGFEMGTTGSATWECTHINNVVHSCTTSYGTGTTHADSTNNYASDAATNTPPGSNPILTNTVDADFVDATNNDLRVAASSGLIDTGGDSSSYTTIDIVGTTRDATDDGGAFEYVAAGGGGNGTYIGATEATKSYVGSTQVIKMYVGSNVVGEAITPPTGLFVDVDSIGGACSDVIDRAGNSITTPFCTIERADAVALANDTVYIREGTYPESFALTSSGTSGNPITYTKYPTETPILDGSDAITETWSACANQADAGGNPNWANMYKVVITGQVLDPLDVNLTQDGELCWMAQNFGVDPTNQFHVRGWDGYYNQVAVGNTSTTQITDTSVLTSTDSTVYDHAYVLAHTAGNQVELQAITNFNTTTDTITYNAMGAAPDEQSGSAWYSIYNATIDISRAGEYSVTNDGTDTTIYLWPIGSALGTEYRRSVRTNAININEQSYLTFDNLIVQGYAGHANNMGGMGIGCITTGAVVNNISITNNTFRHNMNMRNGLNYGATYIYNGANCVIDGNTIDYNNVYFGFTVTSTSNMKVNNNTISNPAGTGIYFAGVTGTNYIVGNTLDGIRGAHANTLSIYQQSNNVLVAGNTITDVVSSMTTNNSNGVYFYNNVIECGDGGYGWNDWGGTPTAQDDIMFINNTIVKSDLGAGSAIGAGFESLTNFYLENNIVDGGGFYDGTQPVDSGGNYTHNYNIYNSLAFWQTINSPYVWTIGANESTVTDETTIFTDFANGDYTLLSGGPAKNAGTDVLTSRIPTTNFPDYDFTKDIDGNTRSTSTPSMGAYE